MRDCGLLFVLILSLCQAKSLGPPHEAVFPFPPLLTQGNPVSNPAAEFSSPSQTLAAADPGAGIVSGPYDVGSDARISDDSSTTMENALLNYLYTRNMMRRVRQQLEATQQRKRTNGNYWKMCAFNAVSCFG